VGDGCSGLRHMDMLKFTVLMSVQNFSAVESEAMQ